MSDHWFAYKWHYGYSKGALTYSTTLGLAWYVLIALLVVGGLIAMRVRR